jgi:hypothetical protein
MESIPAGYIVRQLVPTRFLAPIDCSKIPALFSVHRPCLYIIVASSVGYFPVVSGDDALSAGGPAHLAGVAVHVPVAAAHGTVPLRSSAALRAHLRGGGLPLTPTRSHPRKLSMFTVEGADSQD